MIKNYFLIAWRNLKKSKIFSLINIMGLTIGIAVCMLIYLYILNEFGFDRFHAKQDRIFRVMRGFDQGEARVPYLSGPYTVVAVRFGCTHYPCHCPDNGVCQCCEGVNGQSGKESENGVTKF